MKNSGSSIAKGIGVVHFPKHLKYFELRPLLLLHYVPWNRLFPHNNLRLLYTDSQDLQIYHNLPKLSHLN